MKVTTIMFTSLAYTILAAMIISETVPETDINIPTLEIPAYDFIDISAGCSGFTDCTEYLANVIKNIGTGIISTVILFFNLAIFAFEIIALLLSLAQGIQGAPWYVNVLLTAPAGVSVGIIIYKLIRSGSSED